MITNISMICVTYCNDYASLVHLPISETKEPISTVRNKFLSKASTFFYIECL